jgi:hypothetical protein
VGENYLSVRTISRKKMKYALPFCLCFKNPNPNVGVLNKAFRSAVIELDLDLTNSFVLGNQAVAI